MPRKKKIEEPVDPGTLCAQAEGHIFDVLMQFEEITGIRVNGITIKRHRPAGFGTKETISIELNF